MRALESGCAGSSVFPYPPLSGTMQNEDFADSLTALNPDHVPETIVNRDDEQTVLLDALSETAARNLYLRGPRGTGKTLLTRRTLEELPPGTTTCYISCTQFDTQYQVLRQLYRSLTNDNVNNGYHTAQLQQLIEERVADKELVLVLDELDFLLENDGNELLYYLSRMKHSTNINLVTISANHSNPQPVIEDRALSSLQPWYITFKQYTAEQAYDIFQERLREASMLGSVTREALTLLAATTRNIELGLLWLGQAATTAEEQITEDLLRNVKSAAEQRYRDSLLTQFSPHHHILLEAISQLVVENGGSVYSGAVYDRYTEICDTMGRDALTHRRVSDFIVHLELLNIVDVNKYHGGEYGRTRDIRLTQFL